MKWPSIMLMAYLILNLLSAPAHSAKTQIIENDLYGDRHINRIVLRSDSDPSLFVYRDGKCIWKGIRKTWGAWKLMTADLNGDGHQEIVVLLNKRTRYMHRFHNCVFVYGFNGKSVYPRWLGSRLTQPFDDVIIQKRDRGTPDRLAVAEHNSNGTCAISILKWTGFGFRKEWEAGAWKSLKLISATPTGVLVEADGRKLSVEVPHES